MKKTHWLAAFCLLATIGLMIWGIGDQSGEAVGAKKRFALILAEDRGTAALQFKQGAQTAADAAHVSLLTYTAEPGAPVAPQLLSMLESIRQERVAGLILPPCEPEVSAAAQAMAKALDIPLVCLWQPQSEATACVVNDWQANGRLLAQAAGDRSGFSLVFMTGDAHEEAMLLGIQDVLGSVEAHRNETPAQLYAAYDALTPNDRVFVLNPALVRLLGTYGMGRVPLYGVDPGEPRVFLLEEGAALGLLMEMPYAQGYLAVTALLEAKGFGGTPIAKASPSRVVTRETMYLAENVKLVFPLLQ